MMKWLNALLLALVVLSLGPVYMLAYGSADQGAAQSWRTADRSSAGMAPLPADTPEAVVQVYAARTWSWRGNLAVHTWIATKAEKAQQYRVHHVMGFRARRGLPVLVSEPDLPDRLWYGRQPELLLEIRGPRAARLLPDILAAVESYPYADQYRLWPGPNSNTFTAWVGRQVPELGMELPVTAIGKDYVPGGALLGRSTSGTGFQLSVLGALGITLALEEGLELNILGLGIGIDINQPALKLPGVGRLGRSQQRREH